MKVMAETKNKITPWENYDYTPKILDIWEVIGIVGGMIAFKARLKMNVRPYTTKRKTLLSIIVRINLSEL